MIKVPTVEQINAALEIARTVDAETQNAVIDAIRNSKNNRSIEECADDLFAHKAYPLALLRGFTCAAMVTGMIIASKRADSLPPRISFDLPTIADLERILTGTDLNKHPDLSKRSLELAMSKVGLQFAAGVVNTTTKIQGANTSASLLANGIAIGILWSQMAAMQRMEAAI